MVEHLIYLQASEAYLQTNNQFLSLTDQMNLGVRIVELDTHFFDVSCHLLENLLAANMQQATCHVHLQSS